VSFVIHARSAPHTKRFLNVLAGGQVKKRVRWYSKTIFFYGGK